jgi:hypothetical protein
MAFDPLTFSVAFDPDLWPSGQVVAVRQGGLEFDPRSDQDFELVLPVGLRSLLQLLTQRCQHDMLYMVGLLKTTALYTLSCQYQFLFGLKTDMRETTTNTTLQGKLMSKTPSALLSSTISGVQTSSMGIRSTFTPP